MKIVVLCGGISTEREISIISGEGVVRALREKGHRAILLDVYFGDEYVQLMDAFPEHYDIDAALQKIHACDEQLASAKANPTRSFFGANVIKLCRMADIVFLALHGQNGEDGKVQAAFDLSGIRYTGAGPLGSAMAMDKRITKVMLKAQGIPVPRGISVMKGEKIEPLEKYGLKYPVVVKVCCGGSSVGVYIAHDASAFDESLSAAFLYEDRVIIEEYIEGREFSVGVVDGEALPVIEIAPKEGFYDYKNKYTAGATVETCPADLPGDVAKTIRSYAVLGYQALCLEGYARLDFMMQHDGRIYCLEANTLPGMTPTSLIPQEAGALGIDYPTLCEKLIEVSLKKYGGKVR